MALGTAEGPLLGGRYKVIERLGSGGMAAVYLAHDERLDRLVAVKRMHSAGGEDEMDARRFEREAKIGASLSHPNLVSIFDTQQDEESVLLVMEYVEGETLGDLLARGRVPATRTVAIVRALAEALDHAHANGIVHRDVKPGNVLLSKGGTVKLADLGIAKAVERTEITGTGTVLGTPAYMAPEQLEGRDIGPPVDIYALSTLAFEMLTGEKARRGRTAVEIAHQVVNEPPPYACDRDPEIPTAAGEALRDAMAKDPSDRPRTAVELADRLERALGRATERVAATRQMERTRPAAAPPPTPKPVKAKPAAPPPRPAAPRPRGTGTPRWMLPALGLLALALVAIVVGLSSGGGDDDAKPRAADAPAKKQKGNQKPRADESAAEQPAAAAPTPTPAATADDGTVPVPAGEGGTATARRLHLQGYSALNSGDYESAIDLSRRAIAAFPEGTTYESDINYAYALFTLGKALRLAGRPDEAIPVLEARRAIPDQEETVQAELDLARRQAQ
jgi:serine/threonine-protein kinase